MVVGLGGRGFFVSSRKVNKTHIEKLRKIEGKDNPNLLVQCSPLWCARCMFQVLICGSSASIFHERNVSRRFNSRFNSSMM